MTRALGWTLALLLAGLALAADPTAAKPHEGKEHGSAKDTDHPAHAAQAEKHESKAPRGADHVQEARSEQRRESPATPAIDHAPPDVPAPVAAPPVAPAPAPTAAPPAAAPPRDPGFRPPQPAPPAVPPPLPPPVLEPPVEGTTPPVGLPADVPAHDPDVAPAIAPPAATGPILAPVVATEFDLAAGLIAPRGAALGLAENPFQGTGEVGPSQQLAGPTLPAQDARASIPGAPARHDLGADAATPISARAHPMLSVPLPGTATTWLAAAMALGVAAGLGTGVATARLLVRRTTAPRTSAAEPDRTPPRPPSLADLIRQVRQAPYDGQAHYQLGLSLMHVGEEERALSHLERSFHLYPQGVLDLLTRPELAPVRDHARVRHILRRFHRDQQRRLWTGYA